MSIMPPSPFLYESAGAPADDPAVAFSAAPLQVAAAGDFQSSPAPLLGSLNSGESDLQVTADCGAGEAFRAPPGYVLIERELLARTVERLKQHVQREREDLRLPSFLANPSRRYLDAVQRRDA